jgi:hypothetical protein
VWKHSLGSDQGGRSEIVEDYSNDTLRRCGRISDIASTYLGYGRMRPYDLE